MDPVSQAVVGASVPQAVSRKKHLVAATLFGALSGMAPDLDALIRSHTDPLMYLEYHRQFSHALVFIPIGSLKGGLYFLFADAADAVLARQPAPAEQIPSIGCNIKWKPGNEPA